jgi:hypothetical protein
MTTTGESIRFLWDRRVVDELASLDRGPLVPEDALIQRT